ncbi:Ras-related protein Rac [Acrasis kona]|uniref:Ras-related protein Rac n=1 Tax=Acrasis kona TaxID=1008807 RepID=A0AAW2ZJH6_9EUKA
MNNIKIAVVGGVEVGKTSLLNVYTKSEFDPKKQYVPTIYDSAETRVNIDGHNIEVNILDTSGSDEYKQLRPMSYSGVDLFLICYSVADIKSYEKVKECVAEVRQHAPNKDIVLVGTKTDLRDCQNTMDRLRSEGLIPLYQSQGESKSAEVHAAKYYECSSKNSSSVRKMFEESIRLVIQKHEKSRSPQKTKKRISFTKIKRLSLFSVTSEESTGF